MEAFLADRDPKAYENLVERLLASPRYGERWARHWLDLVRYAESRGHEFEPIIPNAYQYRDYIIRAFNADLPYDRLVTEHIAGDLLTQPRLHPQAQFNESILGTGFWFLGEEVHSPVDIRQDECDRMDNRIDVVGKTFLALTIGCARCHDHKFDAISQRDYYALQGFLISSSYRQARFETQEKEAAIATALEAARDTARKELFGLYARTERPVLDKLADYLLAAREAAAKENPDLAALATARGIDPQLLKAWTAELMTARGNAEHVLHPKRELDATRPGPEVAGLLVAGVDGGRRVRELVDDDEARVGLIGQDDLVDGAGRVQEPAGLGRSIGARRVPELDRDSRQRRGDRPAGLGRGWACGCRRPDAGDRQ